MSSSSGTSNVGNMKRESARLVLADGTVFEGFAMGAEGTTLGEVVFTTGMTGYQEVLTDPSYCGQIVTMTAPQIGNTGTNMEDNEAGHPFVAGFVVHELSSISSNWRSEQDLESYLVKHQIVGMCDVDTRMLTRHIRDNGAQMAAMGTEPVEVLLQKAKAAPPMTGQNLAEVVSTKEVFEWKEGLGDWNPQDKKNANWNVVAVDFGAKRSILRCLVDAGCKVTVVPASYTAEQILALNPDGVFLSNGPGDPAAVKQGIETVKGLVGQKPLFGICLGHQILSLALGAKSYKLKFGHRGINQPVQDLQTGKIEITSQNHGFAIDVNSIQGQAKMTHVNLNDDTCEGVEHLESGAFGVQYHPEASSGPHDARYLFERFVQKMKTSS